MLICIECMQSGVKNDILSKSSISNILIKKLQTVDINNNNNSNNNFINDFTKKSNIIKIKEDKNMWKMLSSNFGETTSSTKIGSIIKHYGKKDFYVYHSCDAILSMLDWTPEEKLIWKKFDKDKNEYAYNQGNEFESLVPIFFKEKFKDYYVYNWNTAKKALFFETYNNNKYNIFCRPDYFLYKKDENNNVYDGIIVEVKSSSYATKSLENYRYQLALQNLLIRYYYPNINISNYLLFNDVMVEYSNDDLQNLQNEILEYLPMFWNDFNTKNFKKISVYDMIELNN